MYVVYKKKVLDEKTNKFVIVQHIAVAEKLGCALALRRFLRRQEYKRDKKQPAHWRKSDTRVVILHNGLPPSEPNGAALS